MSSVIDEISNSAILSSIVQTAGIVAAQSFLGPVGGIIAAAALSKIFKPDIPTLGIDPLRKQFEGMKANQIDNLRPHNIIYGKRTVGGTIFHRTTTSTVGYESFESDQLNEYLHQCISLVGHECHSVQQHFINNGPVTLDSGGMVNDNKYRAPIVINGKDKSTSIVDDYSKKGYLFKRWASRLLYNQQWVSSPTETTWSGTNLNMPFWLQSNGTNHFAANAGKIYVGGLEPNTTYNFTNQKLQIEGYTEHDYNADIDDAIKINFVFRASHNFYGGYITATRQIVRPSDIGYSKITNPTQKLFDFTVVGAFSTNASGQGEVPISHQPLPLRIHWKLPASESYEYRNPHHNQSWAASNYIDNSWGSSGSYPASQNWMFTPNSQYRVSPRVFFENNVSYTKSIRISTKLGTSNQTASDQTLTNAFKSSGNYNLNENELFCAGNAYIHTTCRYHPDIYRNIGIPTFQSKFEGKKCYDPRTSTTAYTTNPVLHLYDYLTDTNYGVKIDPNLIHTASFSAAANICDENVSISTGGTEKRYTSNLVLTADQDHRSNINQILSTFVGVLVYCEGKFKVYAGAWSNPTHSIDESWLNGGIQVVPNESKRDLYNAVKGTYLNTDTDSEDYDEFPKVTSTIYKSQDNNEELISDLNLLGTEGIERAQRLAKIYLQKHRYSETIIMNCNYKALQLSIMDTINFSNEILGYTNKTYRVTSWAMSEDGNGFDITLRHETADVYTWTSGEATIPQNISMLAIPDYNTVPVPSEMTLSEALYSTQEGSGIKVKVNGFFDGNKDAFVQEYQVEYKKVEHVGHIIAGRFQDTKFEILDVEIGVYEFRVKAINVYGVSSDYSTATFEVLGLRKPPSTVQNFSIQIINNNANLNWDVSQELDVLVGGHYIIKHNTNTSDYSWANSNPIIPNVPGANSSVIAPLLTGVYLIKSVDSTGNQSTDYSLLDVSVPDLNNLNVVTSQNEGSSFSGNKTGLVVIDNTLRLDGGVLFDNTSGLFDSQSGTFDNGGDSQSNTLTHGIYEFNNYVDLGKTVSSRITINNSYTLEQISLFFDDEGGLFDEKTGDFDGLEGNEDVITLLPYISTTNDDPTSSNVVWSNYQKFFIGDYNSRAFKFKIELNSKNNNFNAYISELGVTVDMPDVVDSGSTVTLTTGSKTVSFNVDYFNPNPTIATTIVNGTSGDYVIIDNITASSFDLQVKNSTDTNISKTVAWVCKNY